MGQWYFVALSVPVKIDAQKSPVSVLLLFAVVSGLLWFFVAQARRRDARRAAGQSRRSNGWSRRPPRY